MHVCEKEKDIVPTSLDFFVLEHF